MAGLWSLFSGIGFFRNVSYYEDGGATVLRILSIVLGALYMVGAAIEAFGMFAAITQKLTPVRIFAWLSALIVVIIAGIGLARIVIHFTKKDTIIDICTNAADGRSFVYTGFWGPITSGRMDRATAEDWCKRSWDRGSWIEIVAFIATTLLAALFASVAFGFYRQLLDPSGVHNSMRVPASAVRADAYPSAYAPPYNPQYPAPYPAYGAYTPSHAPYSAYPAYGPPPGAPPPDTKPPGYLNDGWGAQPKDDKNDNPFEPADGPSRR